MSNANGATMSRDILVDAIIADPAQPRKFFDDTKIAELAESMRANGLIQPIMVRPVGGQFVIIHGERRYRAALSLGWASIPAEVRSIDADGARWLALVENIQRSDLSPIEEANAYKVMLDSGITQTALGERIGKGQSYIATKLRLLNLPRLVQQSIVGGLLTEGHAKQLLRLSKAPYEAMGWAHRAIMNFGLSVSATSELIDGVFDVVSMITAIQCGDMAKADTLLRKMPYLPNFDAPEQGESLVNTLLQSADVAVNIMLSTAPSRKDILSRHDPDCEMSDDDYKWVDVVATMALMERAEQGRQPFENEVYYTLCLREASLQDMAAGQFSLIGAYVMLGLCNMKPAKVGRHLTPVAESYLRGKAYIMSRDILQGASRPRRYSHDVNFQPCANIVQRLCNVADNDERLF